MNKTFKILIYTSLILIITVGLLIGFKTPPKILKATDIPLISATKYFYKKQVDLSISEIEYWNSLKFTMAEKEYPGETPDYVIDLITKKGKYTAMYNKEWSIVFFSFIPEVEYGKLYFKHPGGWTLPLYKAEATSKLLSLLRIKEEQ